IMRRGSHFRLSKLDYPEIGDSLAAALPLLALGWLSEQALLSAAEVAELLRRAERLVHLPLAARRAPPTKSAPLEPLHARALLPHTVTTCCPTLDARPLTLQVAELCDRLRTSSPS